MKSFFAFLQRHSQGSEIIYIIKLSVISLTLKIVVLLLFESFLTSIGQGHLVELSNESQILDLTASNFFIAVIFAPIFETLTGQWIPIAIASKFTKNISVLVIFSASVFALLHYPVIAFCPGAFVIGVVLAWTWISRRQVSRKRAFLVTSGIHAGHNALAMGITALMP